MIDLRDYVVMRIRSRCIDKDPVLALDRDGSVWASWISYSQAKDSIFARCWNGRRLSPLYRVSRSSGINYFPDILCDNEGRTWVFWSAKGPDETRWNIHVGSFSNGRWHRELSLTKDHFNDYRPSVTVDSQGRLWLTWVSERPRGHQIWTKCFDGRSWGEEMFVSQARGEHNRPVTVANREDSIWFAWDGYCEGRFEVYARRLSPSGFSPVMKVSRGGVWNFLPAIGIDAQGEPWVVWISSIDVCDSDGVVDHKLDVYAARYDGKTWIRCGRGSKEEPVTRLYDGLLARKLYWGYLGWRRYPMLAAEDRRVWLLWEKKDYEERGSESEGILCGKFFEKDQWSATLELHRGKHRYRVNSNLPIRDGYLWYAARDGFGPTWGRACVGRIALSEAKVLPELGKEEWRRWRPLSLPIPKNAHYRRPSINVRGQNYQLFWGDTHCHSRFSGDAEGELDELLHYARDNALLDFCAVTDNDGMGWLSPPPHVPSYDVLTASEWALEQNMAKHFNETDRFVVLTGYEYSGRIKPSNHRIILLPKGYHLPFRSFEAESDTPTKLGERLAGTEAVVYPHHHKWKLSPGEHNCYCAEICSSWGIFDLEPYALARHLKSGYKLGFIGSSDTHRCVPGLGGALTGLYAPNLTQKDILEAFRRRRIYATSGSRIFLDFRINDRFMGETLETSGHIRISVAVGATAVPYTVEVIKNGETSFQKESKTKQTRVEFLENDLSEDWNYYYVRVTQGLDRKSCPGNLQPAWGDLAWSSPIWVKKGKERSAQ